jgi:uncharacterized protein YkwD
MTLALAAQGSAAPAEALANCDVADVTFDEAEQAFLGIINQYRTTNGLQPLTVSVNLNRSASWMAHDLSSKNYFAHRDSSGRDPMTRIAECGATLNSGENLAAGTRIDTAQAAFRLWRGSGGHNRNMLFAPYTQIGIARAYAPGSRYTWYWVTTFSVPDDGTRMSTNATLINPKPQTRLAGTTMTFESTASATVQSFSLEPGTTPSGSDVYGSQGPAQGVADANLPWQSQSVYLNETRQFAGHLYTGADWHT